MARVNLLPWREAKRKEQLNQFVMLIVFFAIIGALVWGGWHYINTLTIDGKNKRIAYVEDKISELDKKIKEIEKLEDEKERLLARMRAIEQLQGNRPLIVRLFDEIVNTLPEGVSIKSIEQKGDTLRVGGVAQANARVSSFMRNIEQSEWVKDPKLEVIERKSAEGLMVSEFTMTFKQFIPKPEGEDE